MRSIRPYYFASQFIRQQHRSTIRSPLPDVSGKDQFAASVSTFFCRYLLSGLAPYIGSYPPSTNQILRRLRQFNRKLFLFQPLIDVFYQQINDGINIGFRQWFKHNYFIQTVQKFRSEMCSKSFMTNSGLLFDRSIFLNSVQKIICPDVGSHDQDRIFKVYGSSL